MLDWRNWCRLCGSFEVIDKIEPEIEHIVEQIFDIKAENSFICIDCNDYVHDLQKRIEKSRQINGMFEDLDETETAGEISDDYVLQLRQIYDLPLPEIEIIEKINEDDFAEIENFKIEDDSIDDGLTYILGEEKEESMDPENEQAEQNESMLMEDDEEEYFFHEEGEEVQADDQEGTDDAAKDEEPDEISNHFEYRCHVCDEEFYKMCFLTIHTKTVHDCLPRVECACGGIIGSTKALLTHYENHVKQTPNLRCELCKKCYKTIEHYDNHMLTRHSDGNDDRKFTCECGKSFKEARHLTVHLNSHLPDDQKFVHLCTYCDKRYSSIFSLKQHIKHVHVNNPTFKCSFCDKMFSRKANLDSHVKHVHTEDRNYECMICGLRVKTKGILRVHMKLHSNNPDDLMTCNVCQRQFKTRNQLTNHMICHSNEKRFKCSICPAEYKRSKELASHMSSAHTGLTKYACLWCSKTFNNNSNFRKHKLKIHPKELEESESSKKGYQILFEEIE